MASTYLCQKFFFFFFKEKGVGTVSTSVIKGFMENCTCNFNSHVPTYFTRKTLSLQHKIEKMNLKNVLLQHFTILKLIGSVLWNKEDKK